MPSAPSLGTPPTEATSLPLHDRHLFLNMPTALRRAACPLTARLPVKMCLSLRNKTGAERFFGFRLDDLGGASLWTLHQPINLPLPPDRPFPILRTRTRADRFVGFPSGGPETSTMATPTPMVITSLLLPGTPIFLMAPMPLQRAASSLTTRVPHKMFPSLRPNTRADRFFRFVRPNGARSALPRDRSRGGSGHRTRH